MRTHYSRKTSGQYQRAEAAFAHHGERRGRLLKFGIQRKHWRPGSDKSAFDFSHETASMSFFGLIRLD